MTAHGSKKPTECEEDRLFYIIKKYFVHKTSPDSKKTIELLSGMFNVNIYDSGCCAKML